jgi:hypothetical protein
MKRLAVCIILIAVALTATATSPANQVYNMIVGLDPNTPPRLEHIREWRALGIPETGIRRLANEAAQCSADELNTSDEKDIVRYAVPIAYTRLVRLVLVRDPSNSIRHLPTVMAALEQRLPYIDLVYDHWWTRAWWYLAYTRIDTIDQAVGAILRTGGVSP